MKYTLFKQMDSERLMNNSHESNGIAKNNQSIIMSSKYYPNCTVKKSKRFRSAFTTGQINYLEREFKKFPYIGSANRKEVSIKLKIPERAVKIWFQNRRMKEKKEVASKDQDIPDLNKDVTKFTNDSLNNAYNLQSINNCRYHNVVQTRISTNNIPRKIAPNNKSVNVNEKLTISNKSIYKPQKDKESKAINRSLVGKANTSNIGAMPIPIQKVKIEPHVSPIEMSKQTKQYATENIKSEAETFCPLGKSYPVITQDMPQDLSSSSVICKLYTQQPQSYPTTIIPGPRFVPVHMHTYRNPTIPSGNVIWKPVNLLSALPGLPATANPMTFPQNNSETRLNNQTINNKCSCDCNCHGSLLQGFHQIERRVQPQYIIATPFINPS